MIFHPGDRVRVTNLPRLDNASEGRIGTFLEYTRPHGYVRVRLDPAPRMGGSHDWVLHPESLELITEESE